MTEEGQRLLKGRNVAFESADVALYSAARANRKKCIKKEKTENKTKIEENLDSNNTKQVWDGIWHQLLAQSTSS